MTVPVRVWFDVTTGFDPDCMNARGRAVLWNSPSPTALQQEENRVPHQHFHPAMGMNPVPQA